MIDGTSPFALERQAMDKVPGETVADPKAEDLMASFYDDIVNDPSGIGQDPRVLKQVLHDDYNSRPSQTQGPYQQGFQQVRAQLFVFSPINLAKVIYFLLFSRVPFIAMQDFDHRAPWSPKIYVYRLQITKCYKAGE